MKKIKTLLGLMALLLGAFNHLSAQNYFEAINPVEISDPAAITKLNTLLSSPDFTQHSLVSLALFEDHLNGATFSLILPNGSEPSHFTTLNAHSDSNGDYVWIGNNEELGYLIFSRIDGQVQADLPGNGGEQRYKLIGLNESQGVLLNKIPLPEEAEGCTAGNDDEDPPAENVGSTPAHNHATVRTAGCPNNEIRILYVYTPEAQETGIPINNTAVEVTAMLNTAIDNSGVSDFSFTTAAVELLSGFEEGDKPNKSEAKKARDNATAISLRNQWKADLVLLLGAYSGSNNLFGYVIDIETTKEDAFAVAKLVEASDAINMVGPHEISHMMGARHQKPANCFHGADPNITKAHGFKTKNDFKDILTGIKCNAVRRVNWSNPDVDHQGEPTGKKRANNAAAVKGHAPTVACFYPEYTEPPTNNKLVVHLNGPSFLNSNTTYTWTSSVSGGTPPYTIQWYVSTNGSNYSLIYTGANLTRNSNSLPPGVITLRCKATDANQQVATHDRKILNGGFGGGGGGGFKPNGTLPQGLIQNDKSAKAVPVVYPNPTDQDLQILNSADCQSYEIMNASSQIVQRGQLDSTANTAIIAIPNELRGMHWIRLIYKDRETQILKFIKQ